MSDEGFVSVDIAHPPMSSEEAVLLLDRLLRDGRVKAIKIIHGYGSNGKGSVLKQTVREWIYRQRAVIRSVIVGEELQITNRTVEALIKELKTSDADLLRPNPGITIVWKRE